MSVWGKIIGGGTGMVLGGPLGALLGLALGHTIDKIKKSNSKNLNSNKFNNEKSQFQQYNENDKQLAFATGVIAIAAKLSKADGKVTQDEIKTFHEVFDFDSRDEAVIGEIFNNAKISSDGFELYAKQLASVFGNQEELYIEFINSLFKIALADGVLHLNEEKMISDIAVIFKMPSELIESIKMQFINSSQNINSIENDYKILLSNPNESDTDLKKRYYKLVKDYHPDSLVSKGLPDEFLRFANERLSAVNEAYDRIVKYRKDKS